MTYTLRRAVREASYLLLALAGPTGSGKTYSALRLASGLAEGHRFAVIDTEARRSTHYVPPFDFDIIDLEAPFRPDHYVDAIKVCVEAHAPVIVIDSMSHEYAGVGGLSEWHDDLLDERVQRALKRDPHADEWKIRDALNVGCWQEPKLAHKRMMAGLLQVRAHLIFCLRAEEKIKFVREREDNREVTKIVQAGWQPICEKNFMYEMTASALLSPDAPGQPKPIKIQRQHERFFPPEQPITEAAGHQLAAWAAGGAPAPIEREVAAVAASEPARSVPPADNVVNLFEPPVPAAPSSEPAPALPGPDPPSYKPEDAIGMLARMAGGRLSAKEIEAAFAPGARNTTHVALFAKREPDKFRAAFERIYRNYLAWKDQHA